MMHGEGAEIDLFRNREGVCIFDLSEAAQQRAL
jgi:hypothetical protein